MKEKRLIIILAAFLLVTLGALSYFLASGKLTSVLPYQSSIKNLEFQSDSDEVSAIEDDLDSTELDDLDKELKDIETEIKS